MSKSDEIDESLYSRQLYVMGHEAQRRMAASHVLMIGMNGLGVEAAKNIILAGVKSVAVFDSKTVTYSDLSANFYATESDVGMNRASVVVPKLAELNPYVQVSAVDGELGVSLLQSTMYSVVVFVDVPRSTLFTMADYCHSHGIAVVAADVRGVFGSIFCDFGECFEVNDINGEPNASSMIASVTKDSKALVTVLEDTRHGLDTGDKVVLSEIAGMEALNGNEYVVTVKDPYSFEIDVDTTNFPAYERGGYVNQVKVRTTISFKSISDSFKAPGEFIVDFVKFDRAGPLHFAFAALAEFEQNNGSLPKAGCVAHAQQIFDMAVALNSSAKQAGHFCLDDEEFKNAKDLIMRLSMCAMGQISPMCALLGGVVGQEVLKACSGKFMPIKQWFYYDAVETLSDEPLTEAELEGLNCRYDGQIMVYGKAIQQQLSSLSMFLVGAGAIGCEMIKNWAMMGIACTDGTAGKAGTIHVTDMDQIEKSNLSRQFLFRNKDINHPKSTTAVNAVKTTMNVALQAIAYENKVAPETENLFNDDFFESVDMVCTALDNVEARLYIDQKCLFYQKPMLESGTLGAKGHTQIVVPFLTESYGATRDPPEKSIPVCTLKHFPNQIDHTLQWAREWFEEIYRQTPEDVLQYIGNPEYASTLASQQNMKFDTLTRVHDSLVTSRPSTFDDCISWARKIFEDLFANKIKQLLHNFPLDRMTSSGTPFWSGAKKPPTPVGFDTSDPLHVEFIIASAIVRAMCFGVNYSAADDIPRCMSIAVNTPVEIFKPQEGMQIAATDEEAKNEEASKYSHLDIDQQCSKILSSLPVASSLKNLAAAMKSINFDKDIDSHMRVVAAVSNLRARNYRIPEADLHTSRGIAGKITPAIATTTALVTGGICLEIYKILQKKPVTKLMNTFNNLALPLFTSMEPEPPKVTTTIVKGEEWKWTQWDRIDVYDPNMTLDGLIQYLDERYGAELSMLSSGVTILFSDFMNKQKMMERKKMTIKELVASVTKKDVPENQKYIILEIIVNDAESGNEIELPYLRYKLY